jgi:hypothetical protein
MPGVERMGGGAGSAVALFVMLATSTCGVGGMPLSTQASAMQAASDALDALDAAEESGGGASSLKSSESSYSLAMMQAKWRLMKMHENGYFDILPAYRHESQFGKSESADGVVSAMSMRSDPPAGAMEYSGHKLVPDKEFVQVMRFGPKCGSAPEGMSEGFAGDCGDEYLQLGPDRFGRPEPTAELAKCDPGNQIKLGYGCWFYFSQADLAPRPYGKDFESRRSSGIAVNVGKSLRVDSRASASHALGIPCPDPPLCRSMNHPQDKFWCTKAREKGYNSIQIARPHLPCLEDKCLKGPPGWLTELLVCSDKCCKEVVNDACPPDDVELWADGDRPCHCPSGSAHLNCGANSTLFGRPDDGKQTCPHNLVSPELRELYTTSMADPEDQLALREEQRDNIRNLLKSEGKMSEVWEKHANLTLKVEHRADHLWELHYKLTTMRRAFPPGSWAAKEAKKLADKTARQAAATVIRAADLAQVASKEAADAEEGKSEGAGWEAKFTKEAKLAEKYADEVYYIALAAGELIEKAMTELTVANKTGETKGQGDENSALARLSHSIVLKLHQRRSSQPTTVFSN